MITHCDEINLNLDTSIPLGLMINELVNNAFKHAFKNKSNGEIKISLTTTKNIITLVVQDNGNGLPSNFDTIKYNSLGIELIEILSSQLDGKLVFEQKDGLSVILNFNQVV